MQNEHVRASSSELMELRHEPIPGYRKALIITISVAALYLALVFIW